MLMSKTPIASLLFLILTFFSLSAIYVLLGAYFIAALQVIVYAGAIMVLFLFTIMLLNLGHDYRNDLRGAGWIIVSFTAAGVGAWAVAREFGVEGAIVDRGGADRIDAAVADLNAVGAVATPLFRDFIVPFEITSILLLVAIIGAVLLAKRKV
ncbi:MAG: NADH-quinone oxidoreductase subunit J [Longimicrobiales bacterium]